MSSLAFQNWKARWDQKHSAERAKSYSAKIDRQIEDDSKKFRRECHILVMGNDHDTSTIVRRMKIHQDGYTHQERIEFRLIIWEFLLKTSRSLVQGLRTSRAELGTLASELNQERIMSHPTTVDDAEFPFKPEFADAVRDLWTNEMIPVLLNSFYLPDEAGYFFSEARRITARDYIPSNEDILRAPAWTDAGHSTVTETYFNFGQLSLRLCNIVRQRSKRKKWIHLFESATSIIFCAPLADYDQVSLDGQNMLVESMSDFESLVNSCWFLRTSIILFLTGIDKFKNKLSKVPLNKYFPEYTGGADVNKAAKYILWRFMQANRAPLNVYPHIITQVTDTSDIQLVFATVKETILHNALKESGILKDHDTIPDVPSADPRL